MVQTLVRAILVLAHFRDCLYRDIPYSSMIDFGGIYHIRGLPILRGRIHTRA